MKVISLVNQKGGVAKTTTAAALADYFARHGKKTLLIDFDPQGSLTTAFGLVDDTDTPQALKFLAVDKTHGEAEVQEIAPNLHIISSNMGLETANLALVTKVGKDAYLRRAIDRITRKEKYDYVILDSNPTFSQLTMNVLYASDKVLIPFKPEFNSFKGIMQLMENIEAMKAIQSNLDVLGFAVTMARQTKSAEEAITAIKDFCSEHSLILFTPAVRLAVAAADAPSYGKSLHDYMPQSQVAKDYEQLAEHVLEALEVN